MGSDQSLISLQTTMFLLLRLLALPLLCIEAMNVQDAFAGDGLVNDLKIPAPKKQLEVVYPGLFPLSPGDTLAASEASQNPSVRLEEASKDKLYTVAMVDPDAPSRKNSQRCRERRRGRPGRSWRRRERRR